MMFVMLFVKFKMFTIIGLFLIPMLILQVLVICLIGLQIAEYNFISIRKVLFDLSFHCGIFVAPQPIYYIVVEFLKIGGKYKSLYYPNPWAILGWILLIIVLYTPFFVQLVMFRRQLQ